MAYMEVKSLKKDIQTITTSMTICASVSSLASLPFLLCCHRTTATTLTICAGFSSGPTSLRFRSASRRSGKCSASHHQRRSTDCAGGKRKSATNPASGISSTERTEKNYWKKLISVLLLNWTEIVYWKTVRGGATKVWPTQQVEYRLLNKKHAFTE